MYKHSLPPDIACPLAVGREAPAGCAVLATADFGGQAFS
jgi:hypothetical protein